MEFTVLQRNFGYIDPKQQFRLYKIKAVNREKAEEKSDTNLCNSDSQEWLMTKEEFKALKNTLSKSACINSLEQLIIKLAKGCKLTKKEDKRIKKLLK